METTAVLTNKTELKNGAAVNMLATALGIVGLFMIASLRAELAAAALGEKTAKCCGKADVKVELTLEELLDDANATVTRRRVAMQASSRAAAAAASAARHAYRRAACANGAAWPIAAAATRAAAAVAQHAVGGAMKSVRDAELAATASEAMRRMLSRGGDGCTRLGDAVAVRAVREAHRIEGLPSRERAVELAGVQQSWVAAFGGKLQPRPGACAAVVGATPQAAMLPPLTAAEKTSAFEGRCALRASGASGWQPRSALPALRPGSTYTAL